MGLDRFSRTYIVVSMAVGSARPRDVVVRSKVDSG
jgi:hypothetical protein